VEILVAEVGFTQESDQLFHIMYDGTLVDEQGMSVLGGDAESIADRLSDTWRKEDDLRSAVRGCVAALSGPDRTLGAGDTEVAVLARSNGRRCFRRLDDAEVVALLA
jgi:proteasome alpha subunit